MIILIRKEGKYLRTNYSYDESKKEKIAHETLR